MILSDELWADVCPLLPKYQHSEKGGRPRLSNKQILSGILFISKNKIPWNAVPKEFGSGTALNDYFREWSRLGIFHKLYQKHPIPFSHLDWEKIDSLVLNHSPQTHIGN